MTHRNRNPRIVLALLCSAWSLYCCAVVKADIEIESFTRYRVDNFDNNNNGYVVPVEENASIDPLERNAIIEEVDVYEVKELVYWGTNFDSYTLQRISTQRFATHSRSRGLQLERVLSFRPKQVGAEDDVWNSVSWEVSYGLRYSQLDNSHSFQNEGSFLGSMFANTLIASQKLGPYLGLTCRTEQRGWQINLGWMLQGAFNLMDASQEGKIGEDLVPGQYNRPLFMPQSVFAHSDSDNMETVYGELRACASRRLNQLITLNVGCSGFYIGDTRSASDSVSWTLPNMGLVDNGTQDALIGTAYTSLEIRR